MDWGRFWMYGWKKEIVWWRCGGGLYISVPFTWLMGKAEGLGVGHNGPVYVGGPGAALRRGEIGWGQFSERTEFDVLSAHNPFATFTTRGCPRRCSFCAVPQLEGDFRELSVWKAAPIICDNNILESSRRHFESVIDSVIGFPYVDFNQGLDAGRFTAWHAGQLARLKKVKVRFSFDRISQESVVVDAIQRARRAGLREFGIYVLVGFRDTVEDALYRLETVRKWGIRPNPMRFQPLDAAQKNMYVEDGWTEATLRDVMRYYSRLRYFEHIPFEEYRGRKTVDQSLFEMIA